MSVKAKPRKPEKRPRAQREPVLGKRAKAQHEPAPAPEVCEPTRRVPTQERSRQRVERILEAAAHVFGEAGYDAATMDAIAARAETSIGSIYQFFPNKPAVFQALVARTRERTRLLVASFLEGPLMDRPWRDLLDGALDAFAAFHETEPGFRAVWLHGHQSPEASREGDAFNRELGRDLSRALEAPLRAKLPGLPAPKRPLIASMIVEVMTGMLLFALRQPTQEKAILAETKAMLHRYLEPWERG
ncbi:TetR/AcrR family transcriptional regulator [Chondromyces apiculatus]|uniref:Transcriptional regulator, TetR family n=1 Tax=Chondromyces apiculatus DSM 436 TaxID=1192034 RepID=A0A017THL5_9BACT|nr:TetR/AcrR family transcriptional regulator [Chondromyces apiculatus]EYF08335.1 Transcriptional regulator, TetR family [Chondromyces apiculatus DSM 436]